MPCPPLQLLTATRRTDSHQCQVLRLNLGFHGGEKAALVVHRLQWSTHWCAQRCCNTQPQAAYAPAWRRAKTVCSAAQCAPASARSHRDPQGLLRSMPQSRVTTRSGALAAARIGPQCRPWRHNTRGVDTCSKRGGHGRELELLFGALRLLLAAQWATPPLRFGFRFRPAACLADFDAIRR